MDIRVFDDPAEWAGRSIARRLGNAWRRRGSATLALSGGSTAPLLIEALLRQRVPWDSLTVWQVDERVAPDRDPDRNLSQLSALPCEVRPMPVTVAGLDAAAARYALSLPERFDVVHLGVGDDGHTASWPPGDPAVRVSRLLVDVTGEFNGRRRMTLTPRAVNAARSRIVLATGVAKRAAIERWLLDDTRLPITDVKRVGTTLFLDPGAAPGV